jgi:dihydrofolate reductase
VVDNKIVTKRKLTGAFFQSLDGVIQAPGAPEEDRSGGFRFGGWIAPLRDESTQKPMGKILVEPEYDLLLGKRTYNIFSAYWPYNQDNPIGAKFQRINKYVLTHSAEPLSWDGSHRLSGDTAAAVAELKQSDGRDLLIQGSSTIYLPLLAAGLIDRLILMTFPVLLGKGKRIFDGSEKPSALKLVDHFVSDKGVVFTTYEPAGEVPTGSMVTQEPSEAELKRREKWVREEA